MIAIAYPLCFSTGHIICWMSKKQGKCGPAKGHSSFMCSCPAPHWAAILLFCFLCRNKEISHYFMFCHHQCSFRWCIQLREGFYHTTQCQDATWSSLFQFLEAWNTSCLLELKCVRSPNDQNCSRLWKWFRTNSLIIALSQQWWFLLEPFILVSCPNCAAFDFHSSVTDSAFHRVGCLVMNLGSERRCLQWIWGQGTWPV